MLCILTQDTPTLVKALQSGFFRRAGVRVWVAKDARELLERAAILRPNVIVLVAGAFDPRAERDFTRRLREHLANRWALLLLAVSPERVDLDGDLRSYDGILSLDEPELDLARSLGPMLNRSRREEGRTRVNLPAQLSAAHEAPIEGSMLDLTTSGAGLHLHGCPEADPYRVHFYRPDGRSVEVAARLAWLIAESGNGARVGVRFVGATLDAIHALYDLAFWDLAIENDGAKILRLHGEISEKTSFLPITRQLGEVSTIDLSDVTRINSAGIKRWIEFLRMPAALAGLRLRRVSIPMSRQMLLVPAMTRRCVIESFYVPYECEECDLEIIELATADAGVRNPVCPECASEMFQAEPLTHLVTPVDWQDN